MFNDNGSFLIALFEIFLFFAWFMCLWWIFGDIFRSKDLGGGAKTFWSIFVIFLPFLGIFVYLIARGKGMQERAIEQQREIQAAQAEYIKSVAAPSRHLCGRPDHRGEVPPRRRHDHAGGVRPDEGEGTRVLTPADQ